MAQRLQLSDYLRKQSSVPFVYGKQDCAIFVWQWLDLSFGTDCVSEWAARYTDKESCEKFVSLNGGFETIAFNFLSRFFIFQKSAEMSAGNVTINDFRGVKAMGLRSSHGSIALRTEKGIHMTKRSVVLQEWKMIKCRQ